jgi:hypothetical protein
MKIIFSIRTKRSIQTPSQRPITDHGRQFSEDPSSHPRHCYGNVRNRVGYTSETKVY